MTEATVVPAALKLMQEKLAAVINLGPTTKFAPIDLSAPNARVLHEALAKFATSFLQERGVAYLQSTGDDMVFPMRYIYTYQSLYLSLCI